MIESLKTLYERDLKRLRDELEAYPDESSLWLIKNEIKNSAGNLCLHLMGNLNHYIGAQIGGTDYVRDRPLEFSDKDVPREQLTRQIDDTRKMIAEVLGSISPEILAANHTEEYQGGANTNEFFLIHLYGHFNYHLGQINYHRRLIQD
ncbi:DUF1572 domain-containing protein [Emticicia sp. CRIBPO]|uniref:DUF1572 family protein n=1 Tax=Emticicia sp. CRIBPO TaxID=2683258 RepID=UPI0014120C42|nr:DUF1572 family protein [Emticicia sp. CRIBPO]NBA86957.1 DUF1572 domain-containing protein [Emticicia sp. CRIBPO]